MSKLFKDTRSNENPAKLQKLLALREWNARSRPPSVSPPFSNIYASFFGTELGQQTQTSQSRQKSEAEKQTNRILRFAFSTQLAKPIPFGDFRRRFMSPINFFCKTLREAFIYLFIILSILPNNVQFANKNHNFKFRKVFSF